MKARLAALLMASAVSACATTPFGNPVRNESVQPQVGYLGDTHLGILAQQVPLAALADSAETQADRAQSERLRSLENSDRWLLATAHAELSPTLAMQHFDCALGIRSASHAMMRTQALLARILHDANEAAEIAKARDPRQRPIAIDPTRPACQRVSEASRASPSYPSGSASVGAAYGETLAIIDPEHAAAVREIGHQIALSRAICGMHYPADVEAGETLGRAIALDIAATPDFQTDKVDVAREITEARASGLTHPGCVAERQALAVVLP